MLIAPLVLGILCLAYAIPETFAQDYPNRPIRMVVPTTPGGSADILGRLIAQKLHERLGQPVVVENRGGAGQMIGSDHVAKSSADGYTLLLVTVSYTTSAATYPKLPFDPVNDLTGIAMVGMGPLMLTVHPSLPVKTVKELIAFAGARPGKLNYASSGSGGISHLMTEMFAARARISIVHVPYKGIAAAVTNTVGGHVGMLFASMPAAAPQVKANRLRALAVSTATRSPFMPELPSIAEAGVPGYDAGTWWGVLAQAKTPRNLVARLNGEINKILAAEDVKARLAAEGAEPVPGISAEKFSAMLKTEIANWSKIVKDLNIKIE